MKRSPIKRKKSLKRKSTRVSTKRVSQRRLGANKTKSKGYQIPAWYKKLPYNSSDHGNNAVQKRCWRMVSQTFREYDFITHGPHCPVCGLHFNDWREGQLGHWQRYSLCNGFFKYERLNMALICAGCNFKDDAITLNKLGATLQERHGADVLTYIELENQRQRGIKFQDWMFVDYIKKLRPDVAK